MAWIGGPLGAVLGFDFQDLGRLVAIDADDLAAASADEDLRVAGRRGDRAGLMAAFTHQQPSALCSAHTGNPPRAPASPRSRPSPGHPGQSPVSSCRPDRKGRTAAPTLRPAVRRCRRLCSSPGLQPPRLLHLLHRPDEPGGVVESRGGLQSQWASMSRDTLKSTRPMSRSGNGGFWKTMRWLPAARSGTVHGVV